MKKIAAFVLMMLGALTFLRAGRFEVGLSGGFFSSKSNSSAVLGISPGFRIWKVVSLETEFFYYPSALDVGSLSDFGLALLIGPSPWESRKTAPYLALGVDLFREHTAVESNLEGPFLAVGGGLKYRLSAGASLCFDGRYFIQLLESEYPSFIINSLRLTAGVSFRL